MNSKNAKLWENLICSAVGIVMFILLFRRCSYAFGCGDELGYLTELNRFLSGDRFIIDDWQPAIQLSNWLCYSIVRWIPGFSISLLTARRIYVVFQFVIAAITGYLLKDYRGGKAFAFVYLAFTPYNIFAICYNTVAIACFTLLVAFFLRVKKWNAKSYFLEGLILGISLFSFPHFIFLWVIYVVISVITARKNCHKSMVESYADAEAADDSEGFFSVKGIIYVTIGAALVGVLFVISLIGKGSIAEYLYGIEQFVGDSEHAGNPVVKLFLGQWRVIRVYWRCVVPTGILGIYTIFCHTEYSKDGLTRKKQLIIFALAAADAIYVTIRFAFVYGSVYDNLMMPPMMVFGVELLLLMIPSAKNEVFVDCDRRRFNKFLTVFIMGYFLATMNYVATDSEILTMSSMFSVCSCITILLVFEYLGIIVPTGIDNIVSKKSSDFVCENSVIRTGVRILGITSVATLAVCTLILRLTYVFMDDPIEMQTMLIERGPLSGIYTTEDYYREYDFYLNSIDACKIMPGEKVLVIPLEPVSIDYIDGECCYPYTVRYSAKLNELLAFLEIRPDRVPDRVIFCKWDYYERTGNIDEILEYFKELGYCESEVNDRTVMMKRP